MYKVIIPKLVSVETKLKKINGFHICQDLDFFPVSDVKYPLHYKIVLKNDIQIPLDYDFRNDYFIKKEKFWYFQRKCIFGSLKFQYDCLNRIFYFNRFYAILPFRIGGVFLVGEHLAGLIYLDLFLQNISVFRGMAAQINNKTLCFSAPGFNGKTTFLLKLLKNNAKYIAEDHLIIDCSKNLVYPSCPFLKRSFWQARRIDKELKKLIRQAPIFQDALNIDDLALLLNYSKNQEVEEKKFMDCLMLNSLYFFYNPFVRSYIFENKLANIIFEKISDLKNTDIKFKPLNIKNMKTDANKEYWNDFNSDYSKVWQSQAKQILSQKELGFINEYLRRENINKILDVGVGNGRILKNLIAHSDQAAEIYGIDIAEQMVNICLNKYKDEPKIREIKVCNLSKENLNFNNKFDFITAIRVLKYNLNWPEIIKKIYSGLNNDGYFIFTMPNELSITFFHKDKFANGKLMIQYSTPNKIKEILNDCGFENIKIKSFSKLPDFLYYLSNNMYYVKLLLLLENILSKTFGNILFGRILFIACQKNKNEE
ncbi:MAG: class I SAM-dependent methyltransferase [Candidatus Parcubacteria bacterium]|nr:class I SAM-dependent methyltransferase [Candidatus Parcubacteria bacterium]